MKFHLAKIENDILTITLNRPEIHNAFNDELILELTHTFLSVSKDIKAVVLKGEGKSFCAGADLNWMKSMVNYSTEENILDAKKLAALFCAIDDCPAPVIGVVQGAALGGGSGLVSVCDYVLSDIDTIYGFTESRLGLVPAVISPFVMAKIGVSYARSTFLSGRRFNAQEAKEMGLVHQLCESGKMDEALTQVVKEFSKAGPLAAREAKLLIKGVVARSMSREEQIDFTSTTIARLRSSEEGQEGMGALLEKRKPSWVK